MSSQRIFTKSSGLSLPRLIILTMFCALLCDQVAHAHPPKHQASIDAAMRVLDEFMLTFNRRDMQAWAGTLNYPHVRFASGAVKIWPDQQTFEATPPFSALAQTGWDHSHWIKREIVMAAADKVHIATTFERFNSANESIGRFESLYIVTRVDERWGIQSRSSLAP